MKKNTLANFGKSKNATEQLKESAQALQSLKLKEIKKAESLKSFSFWGTKEEIDYLRNLEFLKRKKGIEVFTFSVSDAFKEGLDLMRKKYKITTNRPADLIPTRSGRPTKKNDEIERVPTSFRIYDEDINFVYDFIYFRLFGADMKHNYTKSDFIKDLILTLKNEYGE